MGFEVVSVLPIGPHCRSGALLKLLVSALLLLSSEVAVSQEMAREKLAKVKTAYLFNIAKFVKWPENPSVVTLCVSDVSYMRPYLKLLDGRKIGGSRRLRVVSHQSVSDECNIFYGDDPRIGAATESALIGVAQPTAERPTDSHRVLTASDHMLALDRGYAVRFHLQQGKLRFQFSEPVLEKASYQVSSKLLLLSSGAGR